MIVKVCGAEVFAPPSAVPPLSRKRTSTVASPFAPGAVVKLRAPSAERPGPCEKRLPPVSTVVTAPVIVWPASAGGPTEMSVAHGSKNCGPESWRRVMSGPAVNVGASLTATTLMSRVTALLGSPPESTAAKLTRRVTAAGFSDRFWYWTDRKAAWYSATVASPVRVRRPVPAS